MAIRIQKAAISANTTAPAGLAHLPFAGNKPPQAVASSQNPGKNCSLFSISAYFRSHHPYKCTSISGFQIIAVPAAYPETLYRPDGQVQVITAIAESADDDSSSRYLVLRIRNYQLEPYAGSCRAPVRHSLPSCGSWIFPTRDIIQKNNTISTVVRTVMHTRLT